MKKVLMFVLAAALATATYAQELNPAHGNGNGNNQGNNEDQGGDHGGTDNHAAAAAGSGNLRYHTGGVVIRNANVVLIFWGPSFASGGADNGYATSIQGFRNQFGTTGEYNTVTQYYGEDPVSGYGNIATGSLVNQADMFDTTTPPTSVTDATVQTEVKKYITAHGVDYNAIYEVFIPKTSYSSDSGSTSCGGPSLGYCAYHSSYTDGASKKVKYSIEPWPGCSGCSVSGWTTAQNQEHFVCHETREAVTDALGNAWFDRVGYEADDKCAWSPTPFIGTGGYGYQYEYSNATSSCVKTR